MAALGFKYLAATFLRAVADEFDPDGAGGPEEIHLSSDGPAVIFQLDGHPYAAVLEDRVAHG